MASWTQPHDDASICRPRMEGQARQAIREVVDAATREGIDWSKETRCAGCGVELRDPISELPRYALGCSSCSDRRVQRERRAVPQLTFDLIAA